MDKKKHKRVGESALYLGEWTIMVNIVDYIIDLISIVKSLGIILQVHEICQPTFFSKLASVSHNKEEDISSGCKNY